MEYGEDRQSEVKDSQSIKISHGETKEDGETAIEVHL
jgi:hypothetical protein